MRHAIAAVLFVFAFTATAANYDLERPISALRRGPTSPWQTSLHAATDGDTFMAIWSDARSGSPANTGSASVPYLPHVAMAQRVDARGNILATIELPFAVGDGMYFNAHVVWTGRWYLIVYNDQYVRVSREGALLDAATRPFPIRWVGALAARGSQILAVSWVNRIYPATTSGLVATLFDDELQTLRTTTIDVAASVYANVGVAASRDGFAVFFATDVYSGQVTHINAALLDAGANLVRDPFAVLQPGCAGDDLQAASDGTNYFVATSGCFTDRYTRNRYLASAAITASGAPLVAGSNVETRYLDQAGYDPDAWSLTPAPNGYAIACLKLDGSGHPMMALIPIDTYGAASKPSLADSGVWAHRFALAVNAKGETLLLWANNISKAELAHGEVFASTADFSARRVTQFRLADGPFTQEAISAAVARDGTALLTWRERTGPTGPLALYAARIAADGTILDPDSIRLADVTTDGTRAAVASDGRDFLAAWSELGGVRLCRIGSDGQTLSTSFVFTGGSSTPSSPALAWNGSEYLLAVNNADAGALGTTYTTQVARLSAAGEALEQPHAINQPAMAPVAEGIRSVSYYGAPLAASDGVDFLVAYTRLVVEPNHYQSYYSAVSRISASGTVTAGDVPIVLTAPNALFWNGKSYVALDPRSTGLYGVRISPDALPLDGLPGGGPESSGPLLPGHSTGFGIQPQCDANGCYAASASLTKEGTLQLLTWRVTDANGAFDRSAATVVATVPAMFESGSAAILLPGKAPRLVYSRNAVEPELLGVNRVFIRTQAPQRMRAVRP